MSDYEFLRRPIKEVSDRNWLTWAHEITINDERLLVSSDGCRMHLVHTADVPVVEIGGQRVVQFPESEMWTDDGEKAAAATENAVRLNLESYNKPVSIRISGAMLKQLLQMFDLYSNPMVLYVHPDGAFFIQDIVYAPSSVSPVVAEFPLFPGNVHRPAGWMAVNGQYLWDAFARDCGLLFPRKDIRLTFDIAQERRSLRMDMDGTHTSIIMGLNCSHLPKGARWLPGYADMPQGEREMEMERE